MTTTTVSRPTTPLRFAPRAGRAAANGKTSKQTATAAAKPAPKLTYNLFTGIGRLGRDPEMRYVGDGRAWVKASEAVPAENNSGEGE